jgi:hypothetical protein
MTLKELFTKDHSDRLPEEMPRQRKRKRSMSRRYQTGNVVKYGNWWIVRFRIDVPNQDRRALTYERICPVKKPGRLTVHDRRDRAASILKEKGVDSREQFARLNNGTTFKQQGDWFMTNAVNRRRKPIKPATASGWQNILDKWLIPSVGDVPLAAISKLTLKELVTKMSAAKLSAKTIDSYSGLFKQVIASAVDDKTGNQLFPITPFMWV